jgi:hypothetical protein
MKPAGPERDREVAEVRGYKVREGETNYKGNKRKIKQMRIMTKEKPYLKSHARWVPLAKYSTDIAAAMELWEEMKGAGYVKLEAPFTSSLHGAVNCCFWPKNKGMFNIYGKTEADAISGAYLKWKTSQ